MAPAGVVTRAVRSGELPLTSMASAENEACAVRSVACPSQAWRLQKVLCGRCGAASCPSQTWRPRGAGSGGVRMGSRADGPRTSGHVTGKMAVFPWHSRNRNYKAEFASCRLEAVPLEFGDYHPLKPITVTESKTKKVNRKGSTSSTSSSSSSSVVDPLSSVLDGTDPLSMFAATADPAALAAAMDSSRRKRDRDDNSVVGSDFEPWTNKRGEILARYTTTEKLSINLFMGSEKDGGYSEPRSRHRTPAWTTEQSWDCHIGNVREGADPAGGAG
ncbi:VPS35 endosomal protein sorting factor like [Homo sapiens]|uniref:VPS35 endosomal protein-sorting factor-like n=1 Tax=Homo sapiens TaxID=9606 RepID=F6S1J4_HUMAN|nr:VPS35 endosomal protein sorting factor like [Homo sapiens]KAI4053849.1 VPS35 endosomal protein sorting factor like [Homo sapiens]